jgi:polyhydroxybutyrate depolymerase
MKRALQTAMIFCLVACSDAATQSSPSGAAGSTPGAGNSGEVPNSANPQRAGIGGSSSQPTGGAAAGAQAPHGGGTGANDPPSAADAAPPNAGSPDAAVEDAAEPQVVTCPATALEPGDSSASLMHDGVARTFLIHVPSGYDNSTAVSLVLNFHGATSNAEQQRSLFSQMDATADAKGFIVVYPQGIGDSWNAGACCGDAQSQGVDDVGFARALVEYMAARACIDRKRVYATGFSNGGRMSYRLGCEAADVFAAIAPVAGTKSFPDLNNSPGCTPSRPLSLIDFMGSADSRIAAQPGQVQEWVGFDGCTDSESKESYRNGAHYCMTYETCQAGTSVTYCVVDGGGHCWPGTVPCPLGATSGSDELSANELMWELFERSSIPLE